jgi:hypothetical protein
MCHSWKTDNKEGLAAFEFLWKHHCCLIPLPPGAAHSPKGLAEKTLQSREIFTLKHLQFENIEPSGSHLWSVPVHGRLTTKSQQACRITLAREKFIFLKI